MAGAFPFDELTRRRVAQLLYQALPLFYRTEDQPPLGADELKHFLRVLAAPLATLRQSADELHANLFIDTCGDAAIPLLAQIVGTDLIFPDADTNRRDVRGTVSRRQRKGTRPMLEELGRDLTEQLTVLMEGWQRLIMVQDLNTQRLDRTLANVRPITFGSSVDGPLDSAFHLIDIRTITAHTGRYHPRDLTYWVHVTKTFPLSEGTAARTQVGAGDPDPINPIDPNGPTALREWRYTFNPLGRDLALRQRSTGAQDPLRSDRILDEFFADKPADFFGVDGRFSIRIAGLLGAVPSPDSGGRDASLLAADPEIGRGSVKIELFEHPLRGWNNGRFELAVILVSVPNGMPDTSSPTDIANNTRATIALGTHESIAVNTGATDPARAVMLRLRTLNSVGAPDNGGGFFAGATVAITGGLTSAGRASTDGDLANEGFVRGAVVAVLPATWVIGSSGGGHDRWFYLGADGSIVNAQVNGISAPDVSFSGDGTLDASQLLTTGPGAAWPPLPTSDVRDELTSIPPSPGRGPNILHGGRVLTPAGVDVAAGTDCALVFAGRFFDAGFTYELIGRLHWTGPDPATVTAPITWQLLTDNGTVAASPAAVQQRLQELVDFRNGGPNQLILAAHFESSVAAVFAPSEVVWTSDDGDAVLLHVPELASQAPDPDDTFPAGHPFVSSPVEFFADGSSRDINGSLLRLSHGAIAPLRGPVALIRRRPRFRSLAAPPPTPDPVALRTGQRCLDVDVELGIFSINGEAPQPWPQGPIAPPEAHFLRPPNVTVDFQDAYTAVIGARTDPREILLTQLAPSPTAPPDPTRVVTRSGTVNASRDPATYAVPQYSSLSDALADVVSHPSAVETANGAVVQFEDDATYTGETFAWPGNVPSLIIRAADGRRPVLSLTATGTPTYDTLTLKGLAFGGGPITLPTCRVVNLQFCTVTDTASRLTITLTSEGQCNVLRSITAGLVVTTPGVLSIVDSVVDSGAATPPAAAIAGGLETEMTVDMQGTTVIGTVNAFILDASNCLFNDPVTVIDRFHGCIRFSAVPDGSVLPRRHEVVSLPPHTGPSFLSLDRNDPSHVRLSDASPHDVVTGGEDASELGAFNHLKATQRLNALQSRLAESTPAGLIWALLRVN
jgi:hypothetical protein